MTDRAAFTLGCVDVQPGSRAHIELPVSRLITGAQISMPVTVLHGAQEGPTTVSYTHLTLPTTPYV